MTKAIVTYKPKRPVRRKPSEVATYVAKIQYLTEDEYVALLDVAQYPEHKLLMRLLWETGLRISEALNPTYADIYPDGINITGKGNKQRFVHCQASLLGELLRYPEPNKGKRVLRKVTTEVGTLYMVRRYTPRIALRKRIYRHLFRHSFAINLIRQTGNP